LVSTHTHTHPHTLMSTQVDCLEMDPYMTELFGRGSREGLLHWLRDGTLVINNVHKVGGCSQTVGLCRRPRVQVWVDRQGEARGGSWRYRGCQWGAGRIMCVACVWELFTTCIQLAPC
jgi:hypothetical protein